MATASTSHGQTIALEDFDGGDINLTSGFNPGTDNIDGGGGDFYGVGNLGAWPQGTGVPFSLADDSVIDVSGGTRDAANSFAGDVEGIYGQAADVDNDFFAISDVQDEVAAGPLVSSWTFDISSATSPVLQLSIDMGQQSDGDSFDGITTADLVFDYSLDGGTFATAFALAPVDASMSGFSFRAMDGGAVPVVANALQVSGTAVGKTEADTGLLSTNLFLNKSPADGAGAGTLDTFFTSINAAGASSIEVRLTTTSLSFEAFAFDNIRISQPAVIPEPGSLCALGLMGTVAILRRRRR